MEALVKYLGTKDVPITLEGVLRCDSRGNNVGLAIFTLLAAGASR